MLGMYREQVTRVARIYRTNGDAAAALGVAPRSFTRICRRLNIETPHARSRRERHGPGRAPKQIA